MDRRRKARMHHNATPPLELLGLPDAAILEVLRHLDGRSLATLQRTASYFTRRDPITALPLGEHVARERLLSLCRTDAEAGRFRRRSWGERLFLEEDACCGFDRQHCEGAGFKFAFAPDGSALRGVRLTGMGPKLLVSDATTRTQPVLRWQLRVKGNTAVEFGVIPAALEPAHTALHKCLSVPDNPRERAMGFCSQITAGSLLPLKAPVMRGTVLDVLAQRGHVEVILRYPEDAKEISWHNGQPVHRPYRGPRELRLEQDFPADYDVRLAVTSWAKGCFEVLHPAGFDPDWAAESLAADAAEAEAAAAEGAAAAAAAAQEGGTAGEGPAAAGGQPAAAAAAPAPLALPLQNTAAAAAAAAQPLATADAPAAAAAQPTAAGAPPHGLPANRVIDLHAALSGTLPPAAALSPFAALAADAAQAAAALPQGAAPPGAAAGEPAPGTEKEGRPDEAGVSSESETEEEGPVAMELALSGLPGAGPPQGPARLPPRGANNAKL